MTRSDPAPDARPPAPAANLSPHLRVLSPVYHVGTLNPAERGPQSYEGDGLSVSLDPASWRAIADLEGPVHQLTKPGALFVDYYAAAADATLMDQVVAWAIAQGYLHHGTYFQVRRWDDEWAQEFSASYLSADAARAELPETADGEPDETSLVVVHDLIGTEAMRARVRRRTVPLSEAREYALLLWVDEHCPDIEGLWWADRDDPVRLSCPHGVIFTSRLASWSCSTRPSAVTP